MTQIINLLSLCDVGLTIWFARQYLKLVRTFVGQAMGNYICQESPTKIELLLFLWVMTLASVEMLSRINTQNPIFA